jgi:hypothetical protein
LKDNKSRLKKRDPAPEGASKLDEDEDEGELIRK